jgi:hypothetical protein
MPWLWAILKIPLLVMQTRFVEKNWISAPGSKPAGTGPGGMTEKPTLPLFCEIIGIRKSSE